MRHTAKQIAAMIQTNVAALDAQQITFEQFTRVNVATWELARTSDRMLRAVERAIATIEWEDVGFAYHSTRRIGRDI